ncbi:muconolactone Delta-isomerase [Roseibacterium beibuensis]|uniref:Muconolactone Delta-isomerase n=1 Tax=[Roseibacterium] beibuensis TaxID=1193142 RepID=A0ABP9LI07_9RHOB|nr:muconolactone Delta-isomerase [Roseibacterium beibuensis]MCS6623522.1 muconolactone Delta-isomerase [Roseibacterium beibuensis]
MLFQVEMTVNLPVDMPERAAADIKAKEKAYAQEIQNAGEWRHIWRVAGTYSNLSIFDVKDIDRLHEILSGLPLFPYMAIAVKPLVRHPSSVRADDS